VSPQCSGINQNATGGIIARHWRKEKHPQDAGSRSVHLRWRSRRLSEFSRKSRLAHSTKGNLPSPEEGEKHVFDSLPSPLIRSRLRSPLHSLHPNALCIGLHVRLLADTYAAMRDGKSLASEEAGKISSCRERERKRKRERERVPSLLVRCLVFRAAKGGELLLVRACFISLAREFCGRRLETAHARARRLI